MDQLPPDVRDQILERIFPDLRYGGDPDIERYFELRAEGRMLDALVIYGRRLKPRYPDDAKRILLLKLYRTRSPAFQDTLNAMLSERADEMVARIRKGVDALVAPLLGVPIRDTYAVLKAVEKIARLLPDDTDAARRMAWNYADYAKLLDHRRKDMERAAFLVGQFFDQARIEQETPADFVASSMAAEEAREAEEGAKKNFFDLSKIEFDQDDVERIEIPRGLERDEDIVLAFCHKYWLRIDDAAFERIVWLYSKKYGTNHFQVFRAIKSSRARKYTDEDVLAMVATTIATRYSYTVRGELYMQAAWKRIKAGLYGSAPARTGGREPDEGAALPQAAKAAGGSGARPRAASERETSARREPPTRASSRQSSRSADATRPGTARPADDSSHASGRRRPAQPSQADARREGPAPTQARALLKAAPAGSPSRRLSAQKPGPRAALEPLPAVKAPGSVSDTIRRLSGRAYDVYKNIFFENVRGHIRAELLRCRDDARGGRGIDANAAENAVYQFLENNYDNKYLDWQGSEAKATVRELGFELAGLDGIIESCFRKIGA